MILAHRIRAAICAFAVCGACIGWSVRMAAVAQEAGQPEKVEAKYDEQLIEEIVVRGTTWRTPRPEEPQWRSVNPTVNPPPRVRMSLGYDATEERELRDSNPLHDMSSSGRPREPATVIRFRF